MDNARMISSVVEKFKIRLDDDDPALILVHLNQLALEESTKEVLVKLDTIYTNAGAKISMQSAQIVAASDRAVTAIGAAGEAAKKKVESNGEAAKIKLLVDVKKEVETAKTEIFAGMKQAASDAVSAAVGAKLEASIAEIQKIADKLSISRGAEKFVFFVMGCLTAACLAGCAWWFYAEKLKNEPQPVQQIPQLSKQDQISLTNGKKLA